MEDKLSNITEEKYKTGTDSAVQVQKEGHYIERTREADLNDDDRILA